jgi:hypothetical protein
VNLGSALLWGFCATVVLTTCLGTSQGLGLSRISIPLILGTALTSNRRRANVYGSILHLANGWLFALVYALIFESWRRATWWLGVILGLVQALFILVVLMPVLPHLHPRMASEDFGPDPTRQLEPPGFLALNYGRHTPLVIILAHLLYGAILGGFYTLAGR